MNQSLLVIGQQFWPVMAGRCRFDNAEHRLAVHITDAPGTPSVGIVMHAEREGIAMMFNPATARAIAEHLITYADRIEAPIGRAACTVSHDGRHHVDTGMETGGYHCFHCGEPMERGQ